MRAALYLGPRNVKVGDVSLPEIKHGEVLIKVLASNMCGTDLKAYKRGHPLIKEGTIMGHEYSGVVVESMNAKFRKNDLVVGSNSAPCMSCAMCMKHSYNLCTEIRKELIGFSVNGSYSEFMRIPERIANSNLYKFTNSKPEEIACSEPLASVIHGLEKINDLEGKEVAIIGSGAIGLMFLQAIKKSGARVIMTNRSEGRLDIAKELGADECIVVSNEDVAQKVRDKTSGIGADVVIEAVGTKETWENALLSARDGGKVLMFGGCASGTFVSFEAEKIHYGEREIVGSFHHEPSSFQKAVRMIENKEINVLPLISRKISLENIVEGFELMERKEVLKVAVIP